MRNMYIPAAIALALTFPSPALAHAQPLPVLKEGWCPTDYRASGNYCVPSEDAGHAIIKDGWCPTGYNTSGKYCVASRNSTTTAIPKSGWCPSGWRISGKYCVKSNHN